VNGEEDDPPFDDGEQPPHGGEDWFDDDEPASDEDTQVYLRAGHEDEDVDEEDAGDPFAAAHELSADPGPASGEQEGPSEQAPPAGAAEPPAAHAEGEGEGADVEQLTPENILRLLHERAPLFEDPLELPTDSELEAADGEETLPTPGDGAPAAHSTAEMRALRAQERARRRREGQRRLLMLLAAVVAVIVIVVIATSGGGGSNAPSTVAGSRAAHAGTGPSHLAVAADLTAVPSNILIADRNNSRILSVSPKGQVVWEHRTSAPSDAYLSSTGHTAIVTQHTRARIFTLEIDPGIVSFIYGHDGKAGTASNYLHDPQTAQELSNGEIVVADLGNCRIVFLHLGHHVPANVLGGGATNCVHHVLSEPYTFAHPDAAFPSFDGDGNLVVTELSPAWVDVFDRSMKLLDQIEVSEAGFTQPYDANEYAPNDLIVVNRADPGMVEEFTAGGTALWRYDVTSGAGALNKPTLARVLPDGNVLVADSGNDRVVVIDHQTKKIIWQYGHTGKPGSTPGYLHTPDSVALVPRSLPPA
jgi:outer membrane protein assembly factor BamB